MSFEEFQSLARMYVVGALDDEELTAFEQARQEYGAAAETCVAECERLASAFALSLQPQKPSPDARRDLLARIEASTPKPKRRWFH
jgi:anti-sigma-K factor RskA